MLTAPELAALALKEQILEAGKIPLEEHDFKVDMIVSPEGILSKDTTTATPAESVLADAVTLALNPN